MKIELTYPVTVRFNVQMEEFLAQAPIFLRFPRDNRGVIPLGTDLTFQCPVYVEPEVMFSHGAFWGAGAFSYCHSRLPQETELGRYCSVAPGSEVLGWEHPLEHTGRVEEAPRAGVAVPDLYGISVEPRPSRLRGAPGCRARNRHGLCGGGSRGVAENEADGGGSDEQRMNARHG